MRVEDLRANVEHLFAQARDPKVPDVEKKRLLAEAMAYYREMKFANNDGEVNFNTERVNNAIYTVHDGATFRMAEAKGEISKLATYSPEQLDESLRSKEDEVNRFASGDAQSVKRAKGILQRFSSTWRVKGNSKEFDDAKRAMESIAEMKTPPSQTDNYLAAETVKKYVAKNLSAAKSAVGKTRMACSLAFLKQTMSPEGFKAYCDNLNALRGINYSRTENGMVFDKTEPRCIVPDEIGTAKEVYNTVRNRFHDYALNEDKEIPPRDLAMLTALQNLQAKSPDGENMVVEHEALQAEIEKVQNDLRFQDAIKNRSRDELIEMAWGGNIKTIDGYVKPLTADQRERVEAEKNRRILELRRREEAEKKRKQEEERKRQEEIRLEEERKAQEEERIRREQERIKKEQELRKKQRPLSEMVEEVLPEVQKMGQPLDSAFSLLEDNYKEHSTELAAKLIALGEIQYKNYVAEEKDKQRDPIVNLEEFKKRVEELKQDPYVQEKGRELREDPNLYKEIQAYTEKGNKSTYSKKLKEIYPAAQLAAKVHKSYREHCTKKEKMLTVEEAYKEMEPRIDKLIDGQMNFMEAAKVVAVLMALHEVEQKDGRNARIDPVKVGGRARELAKDRSVVATGQTLVGPTKREQMAKSLAGKPDRVEKFMKTAEKTYEQVKLKKEKQKDLQGPQ